MSWDPHKYEAFAAHRERPFLDLLSRIHHPARYVIDAGCGTGRTTGHLAQAFPDAEVVGVDASLEMLDVARREAGAPDRIPTTEPLTGPGHPPRKGAPHSGPRGPSPPVRTALLPDAHPIRFEHGDLRTWQPPRQADVVVSNAVLHWIPDPAGMVCRLAGWVAPGGVLAIQVPANFDHHSHTIVKEAAAQRPVRDRLADVLPGDHVLGLEQFEHLLEDQGFVVDEWETTYRMRLPSGGVLEWLRGTTLRPYIAALGDDAETWLEALGARLDQAYPPDGRGVVFPFTRRFVVARRS